MCCLGIFLALANKRYQTPSVARLRGTAECAYDDCSAFRCGDSQCFMAPTHQRSDAHLEPTRVRCNLESQRHRNWTPNCVRIGNTNSLVRTRFTWESNASTSPCNQQRLNQSSGRVQTSSRVSRDQTTKRQPHEIPWHQIPGLHVKPPLRFTFVTSR